MMTRRASDTLPASGHSLAGARDLHRAVPEERPIALVYNGSSLGVMMASPCDLIDFAVGFSVTEGLIQTADELGPVEIVEHDRGIELQMWLPTEKAAAIAARRRLLAGPVGCGLCGVESLDQASRPVAQVPHPLQLHIHDINTATAALSRVQPLHDETHAVHAAAFYRQGDGIVLAREDVGRHNALDKLAGAMARANIDASTGAVVVTSRLSSEMVQKVAAIGAPVLIAVSAPTTLGVSLAQEAGITLVARARNGTADVFTHAHRITTGEPQ